MRKKILLALVAVLVVAGGVAALSAYEAHVINVTARIENALKLHRETINFGTVFPQEFRQENFRIGLSPSYIDSGRTDWVWYEIVQKPKCWNDNPEAPEFAPIDYATHRCPAGFVIMEDLCPFLSKLPANGDIDPWTVEVPSYYVKGMPDWCYDKPDPDRPEIAEGVLGGLDIMDEWTVDLKVPPVAGHIGQDWPPTCEEWTVPVDGAYYGCDLWLEVTEIAPPPTG